jgi:hypothetical protein
MENKPDKDLPKAIGIRAWQDSILPVGEGTGEIPMPEWHAAEWELKEENRPRSSADIIERVKQKRAAPSTPELEECRRRLRLAGEFLRKGRASADLARELRCSEDYAHWLMHGDPSIHRQK